MDIISGEFKDLILDCVKRKLPHKRRPHYTDKYYLDNIIQVLKNGVSWSSLQSFSKDTKINHYKTIRNKFQQWADRGVFSEVFEILLKKYTYPTITKHTTLNLFIDSTSIYNKNGAEGAEYGENTKKRTSKISFVIDENSRVMDVCFFDGNVHDAKTVPIVVNNLIKNLEFRKINLIGDKAYNLRKEMLEQLEALDVHMVAPKKKAPKRKIGQKRKCKRKRTSKRAKKLLKYRYKVEHFIQTIKCFNRVYVRRDRLWYTYKAFVYLALIIKFVK